MKIATFVIAILLSIMTIPRTYSIEIKDVDIFGYARAGTGTNTYGGDQECFYNQGAGGGSGIGRNEFRLGNECSNYLEIALKMNHVKTEDKKIFTQFRLANSHNGHDTTESSSQSTNFVEAFAEIQGAHNLPYSFWVGKKFYRDQDVYIDDYYYFGSMNGNGAGISNITLFGANLSLAYLKKVSETTTNIGKQSLTVYDARLKGLKLTEKISQHFWLAYGRAPKASSITNNSKYRGGSGFVIGTLFDMNLFDKGFNHTAIIFGNDIMNGFNLYGDPLTSPGSNEASKKRWRFVNHTTYDLNEKWVFQTSLNYERLTAQSMTSEQWMGISLRPIYRFTKEFHLVSEAGSSLVQNNGAKRLSRLTIAPQLSINENVWGRPVLRAFYTHSFWNQKNKTNIAQNAPTYSNKTDGGSYGVQMESFF